MKAIWWTCGCGKRNCAREHGTPVCAACGKPSGFRREPPRGQAGFQFGETSEDGKA